MDAGFTIQRASLPRPGPVAYWLDLRAVAVEETRQGDGNRIRLRLTYQSFYAALDARTLEMPGASLARVTAKPGISRVRASRAA
ncbi:hypothetical protein MPOCJGCO_4674 [Methylobacterium trifolii]|uniref:Uncharacterized protein n=1 Tax=Methylobacterium trifolii TaxID=1003092 RepID=A0ABQ4U6W8_9HYPH|nr:hypothetical protein MPOCJGCO_4674 [Methylobacterium trifolii]